MPTSAATLTIFSASQKTSLTGVEPYVASRERYSNQRRNWLIETNGQVRDNNTDSVPASNRVYPQHSIQSEIDLIQSSDVDWERVRSMEKIMQRLNLE